MSRKENLSALVIFTIILILLPWRFTWAVEKVPINSLDNKNFNNILCFNWHEKQGPGSGVFLLPTITTGPELFRGCHAHQNPLQFDPHHHSHRHIFNNLESFLDRGWNTVKSRIEGAWQIIIGERQP